MGNTASKILIPIGFSDQSMIALGQGMNLAKIKNSDIILLSVIEERNSMLELFSSNEEEVDELKTKVLGRLNKIADEYRHKYEITIETMVARGSVYEKVCEVADLVTASLIVMGTNGTPKGISKRFIGSNAEKVVRSAKCPVITIKGSQHKDGCDNIILPLDLTKETKEKVTYAIQYARYWDATVRLVSVVLKSNTSRKNHLQRNLDQVQSFIKKANVNCTAELIEGEKKVSLSDFILDYEKRFESDLIIIMTKKEESLSDSLSVTARSLIYNADIPVMSIHPKARRQIGPIIGF